MKTHLAQLRGYAFLLGCFSVGSWITCAQGTVVDADFPGGNIILEKIDGDHVHVHQDMRDSRGAWFYWYFRVREANGRQLVFHFTKSNALGPLGPAFSRDGGKTWQWLGQRASPTTFSHSFDATDHEVRFSVGMPYVETDLRRFLDRHANHPFLRREVLVKTRKGRDVERLRIGCLDGTARFTALITVRHHACEMMASYVLEGIMEEILNGQDAGAWLRQNMEAVLIPFMDKDGVEDGDQGKNRAPHDHKADYQGTSIYPETAALRAFVQQWAQGKPDVTLDLHNPTLNGQVIYTHVFRAGGIHATEAVRFLTLLEQLRTGVLPFQVQDSMDFAARKKTSEEEYSDRAAEKPPRTGSPVCSIGFEIPYARVHGIEVNPISARGFGRDIAHALKAYLVEKKAAATP